MNRPPRLGVPGWQGPVPGKHIETAYAGAMTKNSVWTIIGVIAAVVIAWWIVNVIFSVLWFIAKLGVVAVVAVIVFFVLRSLFRGDRG